MAKQTKRFRALLEKVAGKDPLPLESAVAKLKEFATTKFDQSVEVHMRLGVEPKQADQIVRGSIVLPHGIGKSQRVVVFAKGDLAEAARQAGADTVGQEDLAQRIKEGWTDYCPRATAPRSTAGTPLSSRAWEGRAKGCQIAAFDDTQLTYLYGQLRYQFAKSWSATFTLGHEDYSIDDAQTENNLNYMPGSFFLQANNRDYKAWVGYVALTYMLK